MKRGTKLELTLAIVMTVVVTFLVIVAGLPRGQNTRTISYHGASNDQGQRALEEMWGLSSLDTSTQQVITEDIQGDVRKGEFETTVEGLKNVTLVYGGRIPDLHMGYDNELWSGTLDCRLPTDNVTWFTFEVRKLINDHGKVTHILIDVNEVEVNQTQAPATPLSDVSIYLKERVEGSPPFVDQLGAVVPLLTTGLLWIAEALVVGVPLCFACLGVVLIVNRGIVPVWKSQFRKAPTKDAA